MDPITGSIKVATATQAITGPTRTLLEDAVRAFGEAKAVLAPRGMLLIRPPADASVHLERAALKLEGAEAGVRELLPEADVLADRIHRIGAASKTASLNQGAIGWSTADFIHLPRDQVAGWEKSIQGILDMAPPTVHPRA